MKTPSSLAMLFLAAVLPTGAAAQLKAGERCDAVFLDNVAKNFTGIGSIKNESRLKPADVTVDGMTVRQDVLAFGDDKTCDAATWRFLGAPASAPEWRNAEGKKYWREGNAKYGAMLLLNVHDIFRSFDPKALKVLAAADAVIDAAAQLGLAKASDGAKTLAETLPGASGGQIGAVKPKSVVVADEAGTVAPESVGAVWRKLLDETGSAEAGGSAVLDFRVAVLELGAEVGRMGKKDFTPPLPAGFAAPKADKTTAAVDKTFDGALAALTGAGEAPALDSTAPRAGSALDPIDLGLRNLIAIRAAEIKKIVAAARIRLAKNGKRITAIEVGAAAAVQSKGATPFGAAALKSLAATKEYVHLNALYDESVAKKGLDDVETKAIARAREELKEAALSARVETKDGAPTVVFTQNGHRTVLSNVTPPVDGAAGDKARENAADIVARFIVDGSAESAQFAAAKIALGVDPALNPGGNLGSGITNEELPVSKEVPPAIAKINADGSGCKDPRDVYRNNYESYAARKQAAAADMSSGSARLRSGIEAQAAKDSAESNVKCQRMKDEAAALKADSFTHPDALAARRKAAEAKADEWCKGDLERIAKQAAADLAAHDKKTADKGERDPKVGLGKANEELDAAFRVGVTGSVAQLRKDYTTPGSARFKALMTAAKLNELSASRLQGYTKLWFMEKWPQGEEIAGDGAAPKSRREDLKASLDKCVTDLGYSPLKEKGNNISYGAPDDPDAVAKKCGIEAELTAAIKKKVGSVTE